MKKQFFAFVLTASSLLLPLQSFAAYAVFDATNNVLATLQKTMDSAFQTVQKANMSTLIQQGKDDFAEQVKIYEECVKQYEECVKIYNQAVDTHNWIDTNVGNARNLKTFLSCGFSDLQNLQQLSTLLKTTMNQTSTAANPNYNSALLNQADRIIGNDVLKKTADQGIEMQTYAQSSEKIADRSDEIARNMLTKLRTKDQVLEAKVSSGTADMMQILHANEQATIFIAEELGRVNSNISALNRTAAKQLEQCGVSEMNKAQEAAVFQTLENDAVQRGSSYTKQRDSRDRINGIFDNCRVSGSGTQKDR